MDTVDIINTIALFALLFSPLIAIVIARIQTSIEKFKDNNEIIDISSYDRFYSLISELRSHCIQTKSKTPRITHCWCCKTPLSSNEHETCTRCWYIICPKCGACRYGCGFGLSTPRLLDMLLDASAENIEIIRKLVEQEKMLSQYASVAVRKYHLIRFLSSAEIVYILRKDEKSRKKEEDGKKNEARLKIAEPVKELLFEQGSVIYQIFR